MTDEQLVKDLRSWAGPSPASERSYCMVNAAEAIERLGRDLAEEKEQRKYLMGLAAEDAQQLRQELDEARAREERKDAALVKIAQETAATWVSDTAREALAAPAPEDCPHGCRGTGWIGAVNDWGDTAALPCPVHHQNDTSNK